MKIEIESNDLLAIADEIEHNCTMLGYTDGEDAEDDIAFYVPVIRSMADRLKSIVNEQQEGTEDKTAEQMEPNTTEEMTAELMQSETQRAFRRSFDFVNTETDFRKG